MARKKVLNQTDDADALEGHIPLRYLLAFTAPILITTKDFLALRGRPAEDLERSLLRSAAACSLG